MRQFLAIALLFFISLQVNGQNKAKLDTIYRLGGRKMVVDIRKISSSAVTFVHPKKRGTQTMERKQIEKVIYHTGKVEIFNQPVFQMIQDYQWEAVVLTEKKSDVEGLYERGNVSAKSSPSSRSAKAAKRSCSIRIQKKAANMKGIIVYLTHKETVGGYGEMPGYYMEGIVYGFEPLTDEEKAELLE
ncbi:MAG: hypothetical protein ACOCXS_00490 [Bacteroidota bacterium]